MERTFRRAVTGHDRNGKSIFIMDGTVPITARPGGAGVAVTELWKTFSSPADNTGSEETTGKQFQLLPTKNGSVFRIVEYQPDSLRSKADHVAQFRDMDAPEARDVAARHFGFHRTNTIDFAIVLSGEIYALMDEGEVLLNAGDVLVQRGTNHAWSNRTNEPVRIAFVLIDALPAVGSAPSSDKLGSPEVDGRS
jgi:quercetin dioxygenase-like cupin family protein